MEEILEKLDQLTTLYQSQGRALEEYNARLLEIEGAIGYLVQRKEFKQANKEIKDVVDRIKQVVEGLAQRKR
jgi:hypothetical protein